MFMFIDDAMTMIFNDVSKSMSLEMHRNVQFFFLTNLKLYKRCFNNYVEMLQASVIAS